MQVEEARALKSAILALYPGLKGMYAETRIRAQLNKPIRTWGGREYYCEPSRIVEGRIRDFAYKLPNALIQGSAADCTKEAIIAFWSARQSDWHLLLSVHDELVVSVPRPDIVPAMECLRQAMEGVAFDVPMLSEGTVSLTNWNCLKPYDKKGVIVWKSRRAA